MGTVRSCKGCAERHEGCHGSCERYITESRKNQKENERQWKERQLFNHYEGKEGAKWRK